jgi:hypothetical protein
MVSMTGGAGRRLGGAERGARVDFTINGKPAQAYAGESIAAALMAEGYSTFHHTGERGMPDMPGASGASGAPRGYFCGMGICFDCIVTVDGVPNVRACMTPVRAGCAVQVPVPETREAPQ